MLNSLWHIKTFLPETTPQGFPRTFLTDKSIKESGLYRSLNVFVFFLGGEEFHVVMETPAVPRNAVSAARLHAWADFLSVSVCLWELTHDIG